MKQVKGQWRINYGQGQVSRTFNTRADAERAWELFRDFQVCLYATTGGAFLQYYEYELEDWIQEK